MKAQFMQRYLNQKEKLPQRIKDQIKGRVFFYALSDVSEDYLLKDTWIVLTEDEIHFFEHELVSFKLEGLKVRENSGVGLSNLSFYYKEEHILRTLWFSPRQAVLKSQLKYILEEGIKELTKDADQLYFDGVSMPLLKKQGSTEVSKNKVVTRLLSYLKPYKKELFIGSIGAVGATLVSLVPAYLSGMIIDDVIKPFQDGNLDLKEASQIGTIMVLTLAFVYLSREFFIWLRLKKMSIMGEKVARDLRRDLFEHIQTLDMDFFTTKHTGSIISRVSSDTDRIWDFVAFGIVEVSIALITLLGLSSVLISLDGTLGILMTLPVPIFVYSIYKHGEKMKLMFIRCWRKWSDLTSVVSDIVPGIQVVKSFNQEKKEVKRFNNRNEDALKEFNKIHESWTKFWPFLFFFVHFVMILVWWMALPRLLGDPNGVNFLSAGTFVSFMLYMTMFGQPIEVIGQMARMMNRASSSAYRIFEILDTRPSLERSEAVTKVQLTGEIKFRNVLFSYDGVRNVLKGINLDVAAGEMIGLVGPSGSGKSTITKLLNRFYDVQGGEVIVDGVNVKNHELGFLRSQIAVVHQDPYLFHGTLLENIKYGNESASLADVIKACRIANAHEFIMGFKDAYDTIVGERGQSLSGGERQRISIARAILNNPKVLILDEATSAVDTETERKIQDALDRLVIGRTVIAIAHRLSTLRKANRILVVKKGEIAEVGSHTELMKLGGEYKKLQDMQTEMFELMHGSGEFEQKSEVTQ